MPRSLIIMQNVSLVKEKGDGYFILQVYYLDQLYLFILNKYTSSSGATPRGWPS